MQPDVDILNPTPEQMTAALLESAQAEQWDHWEHEIEVHNGDWVRMYCMRRPLQPEQFRRLPEVAARYQFVKLCAYRYRSRFVWGYYCRNLPFESWLLSHVLVVYDPVKAKIVHCMGFAKARHYCERWGRQGKLFKEVRW